LIPRLSNFVDFKLLWWAILQSYNWAH